MNTGELAGIAKVLNDTPWAGFCAVLIMFILGLAGFILIMWRSNIKAEKEDTEINYLLAEYISQLSSRIGRVMKGLAMHGYVIPENGADDDETIILTKKLTERKGHKEGAGK